MTAVHALLLPVAAELYALPIGWAREVVRAPTITSLPTAPPTLLGLFNLRGEIVPILDTAALLSIGAIPIPAFAVVASSPHGPVGLATTGVPQRRLLDPPVGPSELWGTSGSYRVDDQVATLLDPSVLLTPGRLRGQQPSELAALER
ncbi:chemotaxis protein CheW [Microlunatus sp. Gsoil 973]|uniref:chemotaxis protein CheW n=1 Tax=Microlunatus sp. Gsoil 973 TaxID=2672569 RepID=UPI0012B44900|nr:chemotaxis protein CheW [Microlunatus sp. Gsoil 973]QGN34371.1 hypothetical protein GJV80_17830 [Microlunatus sp. Gsoil 973]